MFVTVEKMKRTMLRMGLSHQDLLEFSFMLKTREQRMVGRSQMATSSRGM